MELGDKHLKVQRASIGVTQASGLEMGVNAMSMLAGTTSNDLEEGRVLQLLNMVTPEELIDNEDYQGTSLPLCSALAHIRTSHITATGTSPLAHQVQQADKPLKQRSAKTSKKNARNTARWSR